MNAVGSPTATAFPRTVPSRAGAGVAEAPRPAAGCRATGDGRLAGHRANGWIQSGATPAAVIKNLAHCLTGRASSPPFSMSGQGCGRRRPLWPPPALRPRVIGPVIRRTHEPASRTPEDRAGSHRCGSAHGPRRVAPPDAGIPAGAGRRQGAAMRTSWGPWPQPLAPHHAPPLAPRVGTSQPPITDRSRSARPGGPSRRCLPSRRRSPRCSPRSSRAASACCHRDRGRGS